MIFNMNCGGSSVDLNFAVIRYDSDTNLPKVAEINTIAIISQNEITSWILSDTEPEVKESGMVWIKNKLESAIAFNAFKENGIELCPESAKQYVSGAWNSVPMRIYQGNKWITDELYYFKNGYNTAVFGTPTTNWASVDSQGRIVMNSNHWIKSGIPVDITQYSTFSAEVVAYNDGRPAFSIQNVNGTTLASISQKYGVGVYTVDVSTINEPVYIYINCYGNASADGCWLNNIKFTL